MGISDNEKVNLRRGALLHDIGKMGVPDGILLKPGPLTDEERGIMQQHPTYAYEMLKPIEYLRPALDIPYCHHENLTALIARLGQEKRLATIFRNNLVTISIQGLSPLFY